MIGKFLQHITLALALTFLILPAQMLIVSDADARSFRSSSSFSRSSFRSSSPRSSFSRSKPSFRQTTKPKAPVVRAKPAPKRTFAATPRAGKTQARVTRARFKQKAAPVTTARTTTYRSNRAYTRAASYDRGTYYSRRSTYYGTWNTPSYVYLGSPSYGLYDSMFLYHSMHAPYGYRMAYHYRNDADYRQWRAEADKLAVENDELRTQLATMDAQVAGMTGPVDPNYLPDGVDADLMLSDGARQSQTPVFNACVGGASGTYANLMTNVIATGTTRVRVNVIPTNGSSEILAKISTGQCDGGFVQGDSYWNYIEANETTNLPFERVFSPYKESVHLICNAETVTSDGLADLGSGNTIYFPSNSGAKTTWVNLVNENADYDAIDAIEVTSYEAAIMKASQDVNGCALYVGAQGSSELMRKTNSGATASNLLLAEIADSSLDDATDPNGVVVYSFTEIDEDTYPALLREGGCWGACGGDITTLSVNADFIISTAWKEKNTTTFDGLVLDLMGMQGDIARGATRGAR